MPKRTFSVRPALPDHVIENMIEMARSGYAGPFSLKTGRPLKQDAATTAINAELSQLQFKPV
jgi:hypothetical protein